MSSNPSTSAEASREFRILVAERDLESRESLRGMISSWGFQAHAVETGQVIAEAEKLDPDVLLIELDGPEQGGAGVLHELHARGLAMPTIVMTEDAQLALTVKTIQFDAYDFLSKPINTIHLRVLLNNLRTRLMMSEDNERLRRELIEGGTLGPIIGQALAMRRVMRMVEEAAASSASVLIAGESGTGKKLVARTIHQLSARREAPYVEVACAGLPENLMESELWGHERGAFAGADRRREGFLEMSDGGTLLLDEITELKVELQARLLRTIEEKKLRRMGGTSETEIPLDIRLIATSSRNLSEATHYGRLREDLYSRINTFTIDLPPLRDRLDDIPAMVEAFIKESAEKNRKTVTGLDNECLEILRLNRWPGNVQQLRNVIERAVVVARRPLLSASDLPNDIRRAGRKGPHFEIRVGESLDEVEREFIFKTLDFTNGNKVRAAQILGISLKTLYNRLVRYHGKHREPANESSQSRQ
jgi:DNA-binding NtrC family response regulator